jgi:hypothetical protein
MNRQILEIQCDFPECEMAFRSLFSTELQMEDLIKSARREGWRSVRQGLRMIDVCPNHPEVI